MGNLQSILKKYHMDKWFRKENLIVMVLAGILLVVIALPTKENTEEADVLTMYGAAGTEKSQWDQKQDAVETDAKSGRSDALLTDDYITSLEEKLAGILSRIEGAGEVYVMITLQESEELVIEKDMAAEEEQTVYEAEGNHSVPYVIKTIYPRIEGVVVIAEGAGTGKVSQHITEAVQALFDIELHKIKVAGS